MSNKPYQDPERFDHDFKKRQEEIRKEINEWSHTSQFQKNVEESVGQVLKDHDELTNLSKRLFENLTFSSNINTQCEKTIENSYNSRMLTIITRLIWFFIGAIITFLGTLASKFCNFTT